MLTEEKAKQLYLLRDKIEKDTGVKTVIDRGNGSLTGFNVKAEEIEQVKKIVADFYGQETNVETELYSFKQWESKHQKNNTERQKRLDRDQYELDLEPGLD